MPARINPWFIKMKIEESSGVVLVGMFVDLTKKLFQNPFNIIRQARGNRVINI
jgi:hypothetical protein